MNEVDRLIWVSVYAKRMLSYIEYFMVHSVLTRGDRITALKYLRDWELLRKEPIMKYKPGSHYYALDRKFDTLSEAEQYLLERGYTSSGLIYHYVYTSQE